jgi:PAS domain S-box-containing protein
MTKNLSSKTCLVRTLLYILILASVLLPVYNVVFIYPAFENLLIRSFEEQAINVVRHLSSILTEGKQPLDREVISETFAVISEEIRRDFELWKIQIFSASGEVLYSSDPKDIGSVNRHSYFHTIVAKGEIISRVVSKHATTMEGQRVDFDVVETYVPLMKNSTFVGAFEIYQDISKTKGAIDALRGQYTIVMLAIGVISIAFALLLLRGYNHMDTLKERLIGEIQQRKATEEDLQRAQKVAQIGSWRLDIRENKLTWSREVYRIFGIKEGTPLTYEDFLKTVHPEDREMVDKRWMAALRGETYDIEHRILVRDAEKWVNERAEVFFNPQGEPVYAIGTVQDITVRKASEMERQQVYEELQSAYNDLKRFQELSLQREERMIELKREVNKLLQRLGEPTKYDTAT